MITRFPTVMPFILSLVGWLSWVAEVWLLLLGQLAGRSPWLIWGSFVFFFLFAVFSTAAYIDALKTLGVKKHE